MVSLYELAFIVFTDISGAGHINMAEYTVYPEKSIRDLQFQQCANMEASDTYADKLVKDEDGNQTMEVWICKPQATKLK